MKIEKITFQQTFPTYSFANVKLGIEIVIEKKETAEEVFIKAKEIVEATFKNMYKEVATDFHTGEVVQLPVPTAAAAKEEADKEWEQFKKDATSFMADHPDSDTVKQWLKNNGWFFSVDAKSFIKQIDPSINL